MDVLTKNKTNCVGVGFVLLIIFLSPEEINLLCKRMM